MYCAPRNTETYAAPTFPSLTKACERLVKVRGTETQMMNYVAGLLARAPRLDLIAVEAFVRSSQIALFKPSFDATVWIVTGEETQWVQNSRYTLVSFK